MGNCVARDMGFDTDNVEKNKELMKKMQERINHKRTMEHLVNSGLGKSDEDDEESEEEYEEGESIERKIQLPNSDHSLSREQETLPLSMNGLRPTHQELKPLNAELITRMPDSLIGLTPIVKNNHGEQYLLHDSHNWPTEELKSAASSDVGDHEAKEITISAKGMEIFPAKRKRDSHQLEKTRESVEDSMNSKQNHSNGSTQKRSNKTEKNPQEPHVQKFEEKKSENNKIIVVGDEDERREKPMLSINAATSANKTKQEMFNGIEKVNFNREHANYVNKTTKSPLSVRSVVSVRSPKSGKSPNSGMSQSLFATEENDQVEPEGFKNRFFREQIVSKLGEGTPVSANMQLRVFPEGFDTENDND